VNDVIISVLNAEIAWSRVMSDLVKNLHPVKNLQNNITRELTLVTSNSKTTILKDGTSSPKIPGTTLHEELVKSGRASTGFCALSKKQADAEDSCQPDRDPFIPQVENVCVCNNDQTTITSDCRKKLSFDGHGRASRCHLLFYRILFSKFDPPPPRHLDAGLH